MSFASAFIYGVVSSFTLTSPPLYRYPFRNSQEAFRSDWKRIGKDIATSQHTFDVPQAQGEEHE